MAKGAGSIKASKWYSVSDGKGGMTNLYYRDGKRVEYGELTDLGKSLVKAEKNKIAKSLYKKLKDTTTPQVIDGGEKIEIHYTSKGLDHFANDAMLTLSGKYFSSKSMMRVNEILEKSSYVPTSHEPVKPRTDYRDLWFNYSDSEGRGVYFKVCYNNNLKVYELYSVGDRIK